MLASLDVEAKSLSLPAVSGDKDAAAKLAKITGSIRQVTSDIAVLENARLVAAKADADAQAEDDAARRRCQFENAKRLAVDILAMAQQADELAVSYKALLEDLADAERKIANAIRAAGKPVQTTIVGRHNLGYFLIERMTNIQSGRDKHLTDARHVAAVAATAWRDLLENDADDGNDF
ncbi:MAG: hypothetical protein GC182_14855 [Rhodopseudomonas sp.]|nr:hypothetical protein [Rhodopseudomonas sp.]